MLSIVGIGPGDVSLLSQKAINAIKACEVVAGYKLYIKLLGNLVDDKEIISSGMTQEMQRARYAIEKAREGKNVCIISSGDAGVYGMAGLALEFLAEIKESKVKVELIPGIPASCSCASLLGAPIMHDFVTISLSDILTDRELIRKRAALAAQGDFVIVIYNPKSKKRTDPLKETWDVLMKYKSPETPVGIVRNAYRDGQEVRITRLKSMLHPKNKIDMFATIIIGNSKTYVKDGYMITPRGYNFKKEKNNEILSG